MRAFWTKFIVVTALFALLAVAAAPPVSVVRAADSTAALPSYKLTDLIAVEVKSVLNERVATGTRIGVVVRLTNQSTKVTRVPSYEFRARTSEGIDYTLKPSATNAASIQPKEKVELSYMIVVSREEAFSLAKLIWVEVNNNVYPKVEQAKLTVPIAGAEWRGSNSSFSDKSLVKEWGQSFTLPSLSSILKFTPISAVKQNTLKGPAVLVVFQVENTAFRKTFLPNLLIEGKSANKSFAGQWVGAGDKAIEPGEKQRLYFTIMTDSLSSLNSVTLLTTESFSTAQTPANAVVAYNVGLASVKLPASLNANLTAGAYALGNPISFNQLNRMIPTELSVSLVELNRFKSVSGGFDTIVAKFKLMNKSLTPVLLPLFGTQLKSSDGSEYEGASKASSERLLPPNLGYVVSYAFTVPQGGSDEGWTLNLFDNQTAAPLQIPIAALRVKAGEGASADAAEAGAAAEAGDAVEAGEPVYPYTLGFSKWKLPSLTAPVLEIETEVSHLDNVIVDAEFSRLKFELLDANDNVVAVEYVPYSGAIPLKTGTLSLTVSGLKSTASIQHVRILEAIDTAYGEAARLLVQL
ncbi:hypothetical protein [Cohnella fermenti]|uniref:DUF11 domain-containing protein n=1 Tax=Cohnella fermenti TaxID=2565925 RepID=A0A4S4BM29_9BACL|nr:hypothetical protein [Cohnella fermenti]THF74911.1 hypothetical protein E6C55_23465 [Cohnella fermenti]